MSAWATTSPSEWPDEPRQVRELDAAKDERHARIEPMRVDADADSHPSGSCRRCLRSKTVKVS